jgi:ribosome biogenesis GTPase A
VLLPQRLGLSAQERHKDRICAGMLGFPNVGKSSVINTLMSASRAVHGKLSS